MFSLVRDHIPLEQGLRPVTTTCNVDGYSQRPYSIRTRIKTEGYLFNFLNVSVRDHIPLEQGLRLNGGSSNRTDGKSETIFH